METHTLADVRDIVAWLKHIEELVGSLYVRAAQASIKDEEFSAFLTQLTQEWSWITC
jgi:hypothetical protein